MVDIAQSTTHGFGPVISNPLICNRDNFGHDRLKMGTKIPYFYADNFRRDQICIMSLIPPLVSHLDGFYQRSTATGP